MTYSKQYTTIKKAQEVIFFAKYQELGINTTTKTQAGRKAGASSAENGGASAASFDKQGHWAENSRNGAYANNVVHLG